MAGKPNTGNQSLGHLKLVERPGFAGREPGPETLADALAAPLALVLTVGEAGIGPTRLLPEYLAAADGQAYRAVVAGCPPFRHPQTRGPVADSRGRAAGDVRGLSLSPLAGALRPVVPRSESAESAETVLGWARSC